jgi:hypothetical protein
MYEYVGYCRNATRAGKAHIYGSYSGNLNNVCVYVCMYVCYAFVEVTVVSVGNRKMCVYVCMYVRILYCGICPLRTLM